jgi:hypothetical protein
MTTQPRPRRRVWEVSALATCALVGLATNVFGWRFGISLGAGLGLGSGNLVLLRRLSTRLLDTEKPARASAILLALKLAALLGGVYALIHWAALAALPLAVGFALVPSAVALWCVLYPESLLS